MRVCCCVLCAPLRSCCAAVSLRRLRLRLYKFAWASPRRESSPVAALITRALPFLEIVVGQVHDGIVLLQTFRRQIVGTHLVLRHQVHALVPPSGSCACAFSGAQITNSAHELSDTGTDAGWSARL